MSLQDATAVTPLGDGRYSATIHEGWDIAGNANGGYLLAIAARSITDATGHPDPLTITGHYLAPGRPGPVEIAVTTHRIGRRHGTASAVITAGGNPMLVALATAAVDGFQKAMQTSATRPDPEVPF